MRKYDHFIFDFDGTLSDSYPSFFKAAKVIVDKYGISISDEEIYSCLKWETVVKFFDKLALGDRRDQAKQEFSAIKNELIRSEAAPLEGAEALLDAFSTLSRVHVCVTKKNPPIEGAGTCESAVKLVLAR